MAGALDQGDVTVVVEALGRALYSGLKTLISYL
jgi:hypothetical protein